MSTANFSDIPKVLGDALAEQMSRNVVAVGEHARWLDNPGAWATERGKAELWSKQTEIMESVRDERRTAVHSCHSIGKTFCAATITGWWLDSHPPGTAFVLTTAPSGIQVKALLWREINRLHTRADMPGRVNQTEWYLNSNELVAMGRKPDEYNHSAFQGIHALYVLVILDEACGVSNQLWVAAETIASNEHSRILAIGNPDINDGDFAKVCAPTSSWNVIHVGYQHTPNFTGEAVSQQLKDLLIAPSWVEDRRQDWGEESALFQSKVLGVFPQDGSDPWVVVPLSMATRCRYLELPIDETEDNEVGIDVGGGNDRTVIVRRQGNRVIDTESFSDPDPVKTVGRISLYLAERNVKRAKVDIIGIGWNVYGRLREMSKKHGATGRDAVHDAEVVPVDFRRQAVQNRRFLNRRAEVWWNIGREYSRLQRWDLGALDDHAIAELTTPRYEIMDSRGKIKIESKDEIIKRLGRSPDVADALLLAFYEGADVRPADTAAVSTFARSSITRGASGKTSPFGGIRREAPYGLPGAGPNPN